MSDETPAEPAPCWVQDCPSPGEATVPVDKDSVWVCTPHRKTIEEVAGRHEGQLGMSDADGYLMKFGAWQTLLVAPT